MQDAGAHDVLDAISTANGLGRKPNVRELSEALGIAEDDIGRLLRPFLESGVVHAERFLPGDDGGWASGLSIA
jgi:hypothetical protein